MLAHFIDEQPTLSEHAGGDVALGRANTRGLRGMGAGRLPGRAATRWAVVDPRQAAPHRGVAKRRRELCST
jgi:hypothetical protein